MGSGSLVFVGQMFIEGSPGPHPSRRRLAPPQDEDKKGASS